MEWKSSKSWVLEGLVLMIWQPIAVPPQETDGMGHAMQQRESIHENSAMKWKVKMK